VHSFGYLKVATRAEAIDAQGPVPGATFIAGGTDLLGLIKDRAAAPSFVVDINAIRGMDKIEPLPNGGVRFGALARMSDVAADPYVRKHFPVISESLLLSASGQLRNMASMGGNIMQRTRCSYFRDGDGNACNKRVQGSGCAAIQGINRNHAIFGWSEGCVATHPSDVAVALAALDATVRVLGPGGERTIPFQDFHTLPGSAPHLDNVLARGELITSIEVPPRPEASKSHYLKVRDRQSYEFALVSAAVALSTNGRNIRSARIAMGGVAHKPWRLRASEEALRGVSLDDTAALRTAIAPSFKDARPLQDNGFKIELAQRTVLRALQTAGARA
jgi:xanthine dehydrogenase YagS FAD-binding subunit